MLQGQVWAGSFYGSVLEQKLFAHGYSFALKPGGELTVTEHLNAHHHRLLHSQAMGSPKGEGSVSPT